MPRISLLLADVDGTLVISLSISRSIVEEHGGHLWATNNSSRGASFHITLPVEGEPLY